MMIIDIKRYIEKTMLRLFLLPLRLLRVNNKRIFFINNVSYNYSCNTKVLVDNILNNHAGKYDIIYSLKYKNMRAYLQAKDIKFVEFNSLKYFLYIMTSKVIVTNNGGISYIPLRKNQYVINTWHGGGAYKKACREINYFSNKDILLSAQHINVILSTCKKFSDIQSKELLVDRGKFWEIGMPRNDIFFSKNYEILREVMRRRFNLEKDEYIVLYAPTFRPKKWNQLNGFITIKYDIDATRVCEALSKRFGGIWKFAYRLHPNSSNEVSYQISEALDFSKYDDMQELLILADVLINDFSSSIWDFSLTRKPCFLYAKDIQEYISKNGLHTNIEDWPCSIANNNDELVHNILNFDVEKHVALCEQHYNELGGCETGRATELVCNKIIELCAGCT